MPSLESVRNQVLKKILPSCKEISEVSVFVTKLKETAAELELNAEVCGSIGKNTWLAGDHDIDMFVFFSANTTREELEKQGLEVGKKIAGKMGGKWKIKYAEHPYVHAMIHGYDVDIVPCYKIAKGEHIRSAVDRSPLHMEFVNSNLKPNQYADVRLLKQFCKGVGVYGADTKTQGISGYICELLILKFGSFEAVLRDAQTWKPPHIVGTGDARSFDSSFIVIDPTDMTRNAAAAVSAENFARFAYEAEEYTKHPNVDYFFPKIMKLSSVDIARLKKRETRFVAIVAPRPDVIDDVLWPQLRRARHRIVRELEQNEFKVIRSFEWADDSDGDETKKNAQIALVFELEVWTLPPVQRMHGPPITADAHSQSFLEKYGKPLFGPFVDGQGNWFIEKERTFKTADELIKSILAKPIKQMEEFGIPSHITEVMKKHKFFTDNAFWTFAKHEGISETMWKKYIKKMK